MGRGAKCHGHTWDAAPNATEPSLLRNINLEIVWQRAATGFQTLPLELVCYAMFIGKAPKPSTLEQGVLETRVLRAKVAPPMHPAL